MCRCVKLGRHRKTNEQVAIKIIPKASLVNRAAVHRGIEREIAIMKLINHPHVIRLYDVYETEQELFLVMEYVSGGELFEYLVNKGRLDESEALRFFQQIIVGLAFCHKRKICHRDLKPENLLLDQQMNVKIADFGMASLQKTGRLLETSCGSPHYASPEVVTGMKYDGSASDIWSCGIILYALLTGHLPFDDENIRHLLSKVKAGKFYMPTDISAGARDLISRMLTVNPKRRITMQGVMMHPWFRMVNPERNTLGEPAQDPESGRPMHVDELDAEIIRHMRWLFAPGPSHSDPEAKEVFDEEALLLEIQEKMTNTDENMEKLFYHLLCQHKTELLENYKGDEIESLPDGPRRRADSFPNSAAGSIRSPTPDFSRTPRSSLDSPLTSPGSPFPTVIRGPEPTPLTLNSDGLIDGAKSTKKNQDDTSAPNGVTTTLAPTVAKENIKPILCTASDLPPISSTISRPASRRGSGETESRGSLEKSREFQAGALTVKEDSGRGRDVVKDDSKIPFSPKLIPVSGSIHESLMSMNCPTSTTTTTTTTTNNNSSNITPLPRPLSPPAERKASKDELRRQASTSTAISGDDMSGAATPSIESQVMSTQISEISNSSSTSRSVQVPVSSARTHAQTSDASSVSSSEKPKTSSIRSRRPILHPLDVKASAGMTVMTVSASQHSRGSYSESNAAVSATPLSPTGPKRPWFARLFDFKPQPLTFKSTMTAAETQDRLEIILKELFDSTIHTEASYKRPATGLKCRYDGGVIDDQIVKAVKFKIEISEKSSGFLLSSSPGAQHATNLSSTGATPNSNNNPISSSAVAAILATVELHSHNHSFFSHNHNNNPSSGSSSTSPSPSEAAQGQSRHARSASARSSPSAGRRASDGGSILSSAAAAVTSSLAGRMHFQSNHHHHSPTVHPATPAPTPLSACPPLPNSAFGGSRRAVKVTLHQQQGANSTLRMIHERLCVAWDQYQQQQQLQASACALMAAMPGGGGVSVSGANGIKARAAVCVK
ncbi:hypothetical protein BG006_004601 [Podila minutissima]|uniref:Protein kinase domain-containing protein n=1 Tax=Podila minutissima TaxID=64525 RepID=A0A9P5VMN9_9FUNG|nr:hypothetical protein BG006_004601 [Podila minutissima]